MEASATRNLFVVNYTLHDRNTGTLVILNNQPDRESPKYIEYLDCIPAIANEKVLAFSREYNLADISFNIYYGKDNQQKMYDLKDFVTKLGDVSTRIDKIFCTIL